MLVVYRRFGTASVPTSRFQQSKTLENRTDGFRNVGKQPPNSKERRPQLKRVIQNISGFRGFKSVTTRSKGYKIAYCFTVTSFTASMSYFRTNLELCLKINDVSPKEE
jgi:hypothetical protein